MATAAFLSANNLLFLVLAAMLAVLLISGFVSKLSLAGLEIDLLVPEHISARRKIRASIRLKNLKHWMPSFSVRLEGSQGSGLDTPLYFPVLPGGVTLEEPVDLFFPRRGRWQDRSFQFTTRFPFGFAERRESVTTLHDIIVYPCLDAQPGFERLLAAITGELEARQRGQGHDFYRIRAYESLESARHVDWRATAHTGGLQVREFARDEEQRITLFLDLDIAEDEADQRNWLESAIDCLAFLAYELSGRGALIRFRTQEMDVILPNETSVYSVLRYLATVAPLHGKPVTPPDEDDVFHLVFSLRVDAFSALGWASRENGQIIGMDLVVPPGRTQ